MTSLIAGLVLLTLGIIGLRPGVVDWVEEHTQRLHWSLMRRIRFPNVDETRRKFRSFARIFFPPLLILVGLLALAEGIASLAT